MKLEGQHLADFHRLKNLTRDRPDGIRKWFQTRVIRLIEWILEEE